jgi:putative intracellular protease/amidase
MEITSAIAVPGGQETRRMLTRVHQDALRILEEVGVRCTSLEIQNLLADTGLAAYDETTGHLHVLAPLVEQALAEVVVETTTGETFRSGRIEALWEPPDTLPSDGELETKFRWLAGPVIGEGTAEALIGQIWAADQWTSTAPLIDGCRAIAE